MRTSADNQVGLAVRLKDGKRRGAAGSKPRVAAGNEIKMLKSVLREFDRLGEFIGIRNWENI